MRLSNYFHTLRHLRPVQIYGRIAFKLARPGVDQSPPPARRPVAGPWITPARREATLLGPARFRFLNSERDIDTPSAWHEQDIYWGYILHYFEDLNARDAAARRQWHVDLLHRWYRENPAPHGMGWEPYPLSRRIANWIKWALSGNAFSEELIHSLAIQARYLSRRIEHHLLGNHLFENVRALFLAGCFFEGPEAERWRETGERMLRRELAEQILPDGGHFERSPAYHAILLDDVLDCVNTTRCFGMDDRAKFFSEIADKMLEFMKDTLHADGEIGFFNDSAIGMAPPPGEIERYARELGIEVREKATGPIICKADFGLWVLMQPASMMIIDAGPLGPDYQPGHAHCDTLSYEMTVAARRFIVNSGVFSYGGAERHADRATDAHNTVRIDGEEQHEIWSHFRVARRGYPIDIAAAHSNGQLRFTAAHTGYTRLRGKPIHRRTVSCADDAWAVEDRIEGRGSHLAESFVHLHPEVDARERNGRVECRLGELSVVVEPIGDEAFEVTRGNYSPRFGERYGNTVLVLRKRGRAPFALAYRIII